MLRVAVAEDEAVIRMDLVEMLAEAGYEVVGQAADGDAAVDLVERTAPDVLLVDIAMPRMDGIEVTRRVGDRTAVVVVTAFGQRALAEQAAQAGAMGYLVKPVGQADIAPAIEVASARWEGMAGLREEVRTLAHRLEQRRVIERAKEIIAEAEGISAAAAYALLRRRAMDARASLADIAASVVTGGVTGEQDRDPGSL